MALPSSPDQPQPLREIARRVKDWIERCGWVWVEAQVIQINRRAGQRTVFLTLRDPLAEVSASVTISPADLDLAGPISEGTRVVAHLRPTYYTPSGRLSYVCDDLRPTGEGRLLAQLEQRKQMLRAEGLFDPRAKRPLPFLPRRVGLVTAAASAAEKDVVENARRRWPGVDLAVRHATMQGPNAAREVMEALVALDRAPEVEVIIVARGGGSIEDLLPFSDEGLLRTVARLTTPVISAIGHETDTPLLDLVADLRASTPTDAAKRVVPDAAEEASRVAQAGERIHRAIGRRLAEEARTLEGLRQRPVLRDPAAGLVAHRERLDDAAGRLRRAIGQQLAAERTFLAHQLTRAKAMSPAATLERGYAILVTPEGETVTSTRQVAPDDDLVARLRDGQLMLGVADTIPDGDDPEEDT